MTKKKEYFNNLWNLHNYEVILKCMTVTSK